MAQRRLRRRRWWRICNNVGGVLAAAALAARLCKHWGGEDAMVGSAATLQSWQSGGDWFLKGVGLPMLLIRDWSVCLTLKMIH